MRLQLKLRFSARRARRGYGVLAPALVLGVWAHAPRAHAQADVKVDSRTSLYQDTDHTTITTSTVAAAAETARASLSARYLVDMISSASVDVVSAATTRFHENRHEVAGGAGYHDGERTGSAGYVYSTENDWRSQGVTLGVSQDVLQHNLTLAAAYGGTFNHVGRASDPHFDRRLDVHAGTLSATVTPTARDLLQLTLTASRAAGYQASPYRFVRAGSGVAPAYPETHPDTRWRGAGVLRWHRHLFTDSALQTHARLYGDDWGLASLTAGAEGLVGFGALTLGVHARGYAQQHATFWREHYDEPLRFMSGDRELSTFADVFAGARLVWARRLRGWLSEVHAEVRGDGFQFWFRDFAPLSRRGGLVADVALGATL